MNILIQVILIGFLVSCGTNTFNEIETNQDPKEQATVALDQGDYGKAIRILTEALTDDPNNYTYISLMASAKAQQAGVDTMDFALNMASSDNSSAGGDGITGLFGVVPNASAENIALLQEAVDLMDSIPGESITEADKFKSSMFYSSLMTMRTKSLDTDGDGELSPEELAANLDEATASAIINDLTGAESILSNYSATDGTSSAAGNVSQIKAAIDAQDGSTDAERLTNYLSS